MPWKECSAVSQREEFVRLARIEGANVAGLCRAFGVSRKTGYKWLERYIAFGADGLKDRSRRPCRSPGRTREAMEQSVLGVRRKHPAWGGRKIRRVLHTEGRAKVPSASTITMILLRHKCIEKEESGKHRAFVRFEHERPNDLWQMDFKGHFALEKGRCHPLTLLDDHSRYCVGLAACGNERSETVRHRLTSIFRRYGLPRRMLMDYGSPWGNDVEHPWTPLTVWLLRLEIGVSYGRPYHPQTQGKEERFHRTLKVEVLKNRQYRNLSMCQRAFDDWRDTYNLHRPHEALDLETPVTRYALSPRVFPEKLPEMVYAPGDPVRKVHGHGKLNFHGHEYAVGKAFQGYPVGLRATDEDGVWDLYFNHQRIACVDERTKTLTRSRRESSSVESGRP